MRRTRLLLLLLTVTLSSLAASPAAGAAVSLVVRDEPVAGGRALAAAGVRVLPARAAPARFDLIGVHWRGRGRVSFRTAPAGGAWTAWRAARPEPEDIPDAGSAEARATRGWKLGNPYWVGGATRVQFRLEGRVSRLRAYYVTSPVKARPRRLPTIAGTPAIVSRAAWGADEQIVRARPSYASSLRFAVVHHTAGAAPSSPEESAAIVRAIEVYHVKGNGWNDIGYNFVVDPFGQVFEGRGGGIERNVIGAHAQGFNTGSVGIAVLGTYTKAPISAAAQDALARLIAWRLDIAHVDPVSRLVATSYGNARYRAGAEVPMRAVSGHRDTGPTSCPGDALYGQLDAIAQAAAGIGLPKLYEPAVTGGLGGPVRFTSRLSSVLPWTVTVTDDAGNVVASGSGTGAAVDWTWDATGALSGHYAYAIAAGPGVRPATGTIGGPVSLSVGPVDAEPAVVTPNGDGSADATTLSFAVTRPASVEVGLLDAAGAQVATLRPATSAPAGPVTVAWDAAAVTDGRYTVLVKATAGGKTATRRRTLVVDRTLGGLATSAALSPNGDGRLDTLSVGFDLSRAADVRVRVLAGKRSIARVFAGRVDAAGRQALSWDGRKRLGRVPDGSYTLEVTASTELGTRRLVAPFVLDTTRPQISAARARPTTRGAVLVRFRLSEAARVKVWLGGSAAGGVERAAGVRSFWHLGDASRVRLVAWDAAGNVSRPARARVRG